MARFKRSKIGPDGRKVSRHRELIEKSARDAGVDFDVANDVIRRYFDHVADQLLHTGQWFVPGIIRAEVRRSKPYRHPNGSYWSLPIFKINYSPNFKMLMGIVYGGRLREGLEVNADNWNTALNYISTRGNMGLLLEDDDSGWSKQAISLR